MLIWIGSQTPYAIHHGLPNIVLTDEYNICKNYGIDNKGQCQAAAIKGFYNKRYTIYLPSHSGQTASRKQPVWDIWKCRPTSCRINGMWITTLPAPPTPSRWSCSKPPVMTE